MKDIDKLLKRHSLKPKRGLNNNFTDTVLAKIKEQPHQNHWWALGQRLQLWRFGKTGILSLAGIILIGGTAAAVALWPSPSVTQTSTTPLPSGNHIVSLDAKNCNYFGNLDGSAPETSDEKIYYEVRQGSKLTDQQLASTIQGICEENISNNAIAAIEKQLPQPGNSSEALTINNISQDSLTVSLDQHYDAALYNIKSNLTYTQFSNDLLVYNQTAKIAFSDLKAGDTVKLIVRDNSNKSSETSKSYNPLNYPENITILAILKIPPLTADPTTFYTSLGKDFVRVDACPTSPTGFCRVYDFNH